MHIFIDVLDFKIIEITFLLSLLGLHLLLNLLLHDDTVLPVPVPVGDCALHTAVTGLQREVSSQDLHVRGQSANTFLQPAQRLFLMLVTSAWQNQQILSALSLMLSLPEALAWAAVRTVASSSLLASAAALFCRVFFPSCRIFLILFLFPASGQSLGQRYTLGF